MTAVAWGVALVATLAALLARRELMVAREGQVRAAHEVRGALTALALAVERVAPGHAAPLELEVLRARAALEDLGRARRELGPANEAVERVDVHALVAAVLGAVRARGTGTELRGPAPGVDGVQVWGDRVRLGQALLNLLTNAIEHGGGPVSVAVRCEGFAVRIEVSDAGAGLPAPVAELARRARGGRGSRGRGLAIASEIALRHGGRLSAAPSAGGARLVLELPLAGAAVRAVP